MTRWTDFIKEWAKNNGTTYKEAMSNPEASKEYNRMYKTQSPETTEYQKVKEKTVKYERDQTQKELSDLSQYQKLKDRTVQFQRDEAQKDLMRMSQYQKLKDRTVQFQRDKEKKQERKQLRNQEPVLRSSILKLYDMTHKSKLIKENTTGYKEIQGNLVRLNKTLSEIKKRLRENIVQGTNLSNYISREEYDNIKKLDPKELGLLGNSAIESKLYGIIKKLMEEAKNELFLLKMFKLYPEEE
jgi:hypothetical protein